MQYQNIIKLTFVSKEKSKVVNKADLIFESARKKPTSCRNEVI